MKVFVFVRGEESPFKRTVVRELMAGLNPDINHVRAIRVSMQDKMPHHWDKPDPKTLKSDMKAADKDCKNLVRRLLAGSHQERFILVDNESILPVHWQSYYNIANAVCVEALAIGVDVYTPDKFFKEGEKRKNNEQRAKSDLFIASVSKYLLVEKDEDVLEAITTIKTLIKE